MLHKKYMNIYLLQKLQLAAFYSTPFPEVTTVNNSVLL